MQHYHDRKTTSYDPFAAEKFVNPAVSGGLAALGQQAMVPGQLAKPNPYPEGSEAWSWYNDQKSNAEAQWAPEMAVGMIGSPAAVGGLPGTVGSGPFKALAPEMGFGSATPGTFKENWLLRYSPGVVHRNW